MDGVWDTVESAKPDMGWDLFSSVHFIFLAACVILSVAAAISYRYCNEKGRRIYRLVIAALLIENHIADQIFLIAVGRWTPDHLPLHMCSLGSFIIIAHAFIKKPNDMLAGLIYAIALPGATLALLTPNWSVLPVFNFSGLQSWIFHILMIMYVAMLLGGGYVPSFVHIRKAVPVLLGVIAVIFILNKIIGTDFLFMNGGKSVGWVSALAGVMGEYGYLIIFPVIMALLWTAMFLPFDIHRLKKLKREKQTTTQPV